MAGKSMYFERSNQIKASNQRVGSRLDPALIAEYRRLAIFYRDKGMSMSAMSRAAGVDEEVVRRLVNRLVLSPPNAARLRIYFAARKDELPEPEHKSACPEEAIIRGLENARRPAPLLDMIDEFQE